MSNFFKFLIIDTYYPQFLSFLYNKFPDLNKRDYISQREFIMEQCFGTANFYSKNLKKLGFEAEEIIANNQILQMQWAIENGFIHKKSNIYKFLIKIPKLISSFTKIDITLEILKKQIEKFKPEILYVQDLSFCPPSFLKEMKKSVKLIVGQIACPLPKIDYLEPYDLILSSFPHYVKRFKLMGLKSEYFKIGFEPSILDKIKNVERKFNCTFVGGISLHHKKGIKILEEVAKRIDIDIFGYGAETLERNSPIIPKHRGEAWGIDMYKILLSSKITINRHIEVAENYANNMRLFEATGCGALLITDYKDNLNELFEIGKEIIAYKDVEELIELIKYYMIHEKESQEIAKAGQKRTLREHNYFNRMCELIEIINKYMRVK